jgi:hypothetical protein
MWSWCTFVQSSQTDLFAEMVCRRHWETICPIRLLILLERLKADYHSPRAIDDQLRAVPAKLRLFLLAAFLFPRFGPRSIIAFAHARQTPKICIPVGRCDLSRWPIVRRFLTETFMWIMCDVCKKLPLASDLGSKSSFRTIMGVKLIYYYVKIIKLEPISQ